MRVCVSLCHQYVEPSGHYMYRQVNIQQFYVDLRKKAIISLYSIDWLVFIAELECVYCAVRNIINVNISLYRLITIGCIQLTPQIAS
jgi:hypothetical protein